MKMTEPQRLAAIRATNRAKKILKIGDKLFIRQCGDSRSTVKMTGWDGIWITSATRNDIHALHILKINGVNADLSK